MAYNFFICASELIDLAIFSLDLFYRPTWRFVDYGSIRHASFSCEEFLAGRCRCKNVIESTTFQSSCCVPSLRLQKLGVSQRLRPRCPLVSLQSAPKCDAFNRSL